MAATLLGVAACGTTENKPADNSGKTIKVWLMVDAQTGWQKVVDDATARFKAKTGANVAVEYQQWGGLVTKVDTALAGADAPDVLELGNTQMPKYTNTGAFAEIKKGEYENSANWLTGLAGACDVDGKTFCVPYYAGARVLIYRKDLFERSNITVPTTYDDFIKAADKLKADNKDSKFGAIYMPTNWFAAASWAQAGGGKIAEKVDGKWKGQLSQPASVEGLKKWVDLVKNYSKADPSKDENDQAQIFAQGNSGMFYGNGWEQGTAEKQPKDPNDKNSPMVETAVAGKLAAAPMPGVPSFLGGSNLAITSKSKNQDLAAEWVKIFTDTKSMEGLIAAKALPNATNLLDKAAADPAMTATANAAKNSWITPPSAKWAAVEDASVLQNMLRDVLKGTKTVEQGAAWADEQITTILNAA
jgi:N,N'-diacetylchitobiose transport system substrate-binding protein